MPAAVNGMKECTKCGETKDVSEYGKRKNRSSGLRSKCNECRRQYRQNNKEQIAQKQREYRANNKEKIAEVQRRWRQENKEKLSNKRREYYKSNAEIILKKQKKYVAENREKVLERHRQYYRRNADRIKAYQKSYNQDESNSKKIRERKRQYRKDNVAAERLRRRQWHQNQVAAVYEIRNKITGKTYVGQSTRSHSRLYEHKRLLSRGTHINLSLQSDYNKYGLNAFEFNIISEYPSHTTSKILLEAEAIEILKRVRAKQEIYNNAIPQDDGRTFIDVDYTEEEFTIIIDNSIERDMSTTEFLCMVISEWGASNLTSQNNSETKEE